MVSRSGHCGITYEHSPAEGPPLMVLTDHILSYCSGGGARHGSGLPALDLPPPRPLTWKLSDSLLAAVDTAQEVVTI